MQNLHNEVHFISNACNGTKWVLKKNNNTSAFSGVSRTRQYTICYSAVPWNVDMTDTSGHVTKQDQRSYVKNETLCRPFFWTTCGKCGPPLILQTWVCAVKLEEPFRSCRFPTLNDLNLAMTRRIRELNSNVLFDDVKKLPDRWKCDIDWRNVKIDLNE